MPLTSVAKAFGIQRTEANATSPKLRNLLSVFIENMGDLLIAYSILSIMSFAYKLYTGAIAWKIEHIKKGLGFWKFS
jgi:hypothetical protein